MSVANSNGGLGRGGAAMLAGGLMAAMLEFAGLTPTYGLPLLGACAAAGLAVTVLRPLLN